MDSLHKQTLLCVDKHGDAAAGVQVSADHCQPGSSGDRSHQGADPGEAWALRKPGNQFNHEMDWIGGSDQNF